MMFDWNGLKKQNHFVLKQVSNPLKYCNYALPFPMSIGLPFMPCDLPNEYELYATDELYLEFGGVYLTFEEEVSFWNRFLLPASHRPWSIVGKDGHNYTPYYGTKEINCCLSESDRPTVKVVFQDRYVGKIVERTILNCCCWTDIFQQFEIFNEKDELIYQVISRNPQRGHLVILPCWGFDKIYYEILKVSMGTETAALNDLEEERLIGGHKVGEIVHLFNGFTEYTSKNDKYGLTMPEDASEEQKCLLVYCALLIDYLLFQNF